MAVSIIGGGNQSTRRKPPTCRKSLTSSHNGVLSKPRVRGIRNHNVSLIGTDCIGSYKLPYDHDHDGPLRYFHVDYISDCFQKDILYRFLIFNNWLLTLTYYTIICQIFECILGGLSLVNIRIYVRLKISCSDSVTFFVCILLLWSPYVTL
jgi:hypothetical protein